MISSAIYHGTVYHERFRPTRHAFAYQIYLFWLNLDELPDLDGKIKHFSSTHRSFIEYRRTDYVGDKNTSLKQAVLDKVKQLQGVSIPAAEVFLLSQLRTLGLHFNPVNFYFIRPHKMSAFTYMLAEVSNTPWNERHYYVVDLATQTDTDKAFHVSPFNPMDMVYKWRIQQPGASLSLAMECHQQHKDFTAGLQLTREPLTSKSLRRALIKIPSMTVKTVCGIYWQALRLWLKRTPIYSHPNS